MPRRARAPIRSASAISAPPDAALARPGIDHEGEDPHDPVVVLEARQGMDRDEPEDRAIVLRDDDLRRAPRRTGSSRSTMSLGPAG